MVPPASGYMPTVMSADARSRLPSLDSSPGSLAQITAEPRPGTVAERAAGDDVARLQVVTDRNPRDQLGGGEDHAVGGARGPQLTVDVDGSAQGRHVGQLVDGGDPRADAVREVLALLRAHAHPHL